MRAAEPAPRPARPQASQLATSSRHVAARSNGNGFSKDSRPSHHRRTLGPWVVLFGVKHDEGQGCSSQMPPISRAASSASIRERRSIARRNRVAGDPWAVTQRMFPYADPFLLPERFDFGNVGCECLLLAGRKPEKRLANRRHSHPTFPKSNRSGRRKRFAYGNIRS